MKRFPNQSLLQYNTFGIDQKCDELIVFESEKDQRFYLMNEIEKAGVMNPQAHNNWKFVPEEWTKPAIERDRKLIFGN